MGINKNKKVNFLKKNYILMNLVPNTIPTIFDVLQDWKISSIGGESACIFYCENIAAIEQVENKKKTLADE